MAGQREIGVGDAARSLSAVGPRTAGTAEALVEANGTIREDGDGVAIVVNATAECYPPYGATGASTALAEVGADCAILRLSVPC